MKFSNQRFTLSLVLLASALWLGGCLPPGAIAVIGQDQDGNPAQVLVSREEYASRLRVLVGSVNEVLTPVLARQAKAGRGWMLRTVAMGVGVNAEIGVGPYKVGAIPRSRLIFSNSKDPVLP